MDLELGMWNFSNTIHIYIYLLKNILEKKVCVRFIYLIVKKSLPFSKNKCRQCHVLLLSRYISVYSQHTFS